jgi:hypothetical protein
MNARVYSLLCALLTMACVLPDYEVVGSQSREKPDAGSDSGPTAATSSELSKIFPEAPSDCESCAKDNCGIERATCGSDCDGLRWPISPAWRVSDRADEYVRCIAEKCDSQCEVLWGCTKKYGIDEPEGSSVTIRVTDAVAQGEIEGIRVKACQDLDPACQIDIGQSSTSVTNASGRAVLALPRSFDGYFLLEQNAPPEEGAAFVPMTVIWSQPLYKVEPLLTVSMFKVGVIPALAMNNEKILPSKGHMVFKAQNCLPQRYVGDQDANAEAEGVIANYAPMGEGSKVYYARNGLKISPTAVDTSYDGQGFGGAFNLSPGQVSVTAVHHDVEVSNAVYSVRPDTLGIVFLLPKTQ